MLFQENKPFVIGISGNMGAGKSTLAKLLASELDATLISWDDFDEISEEPEDYVDWYHRGSNYSEFKREELAKVLARLKNGKNFIHPLFNRELIATKYIIFDASLGKFHKETGQYINTCIHIEVPLDISLCRHILRDFKDSNKSKEALLEWLDYYVKHSRPLFNNS